MKRHGLSLQRPKRNQKIPLTEAHERATSFYNYLRRASTWGPKRGAMGAFVSSDVCNFDESPLSLFGDQTKRSINYVNVDNEVEGAICSKVSIFIIKVYQIIQTTHFQHTRKKFNGLMKFSQSAS
jgi:hypothetical protein